MAGKNQSGLGGAGRSNTTALETSNSAIQTAVQVMDDWDESDRAKVNPIVGQAGVAGGTGASGATTQRVVLADSMGKTIKSAKFTQTNAGTLEVVAAVTSKRIKVFAVKLGSSADDMTVKFKSHTAGDLEEAIEVDDGGGYVECVTPPAFLFGTTAGEALDLVVTGTGTISGRISYWDDDAT